MEIISKNRKNIANRGVVFGSMLAVDSANTAWRRDVAARLGRPARSAVGEEGTKAAFLLVQHADRDAAFQVAVLSLIERAYLRMEVRLVAVAIP